MHTRKRAFILTEVLTGMMLQAGFILTLCGAFYMLVSFSTSTQQILAAHDEGQMVISYIDNRIRSAGIGLWKCESPDIVSADFRAWENFRIKSGDLPVAITSTSITDPDVIVMRRYYVSKDHKCYPIYKGNVLTLLYAHRDTNDDANKLILQGHYEEAPDKELEINHSTSLDERKLFRFIATTELKSNFFFGNKSTYGSLHKNINSWAVTEASGVPFRVSEYAKTGSAKSSYAFYIGAPYADVTIYPMSELLNLECENMYVDISKSTSERSFMIRNLIYKGSQAQWTDGLPHAKNILEIFMTLDTSPAVPIFTLKVLVSEGINQNENTQRPADWPEEYWYEDTNNGHEDFRKHRVHISQASWKLYNLTKLFD